MLYFDEDDNTFNSNIAWHGISLQIAELQNEKLYQVSEQNIVNGIDRIEEGFKEIISKLDQRLPWVINHDDKDLPWIKGGDDKILKIKNLFKQYNIPFSFIGCLILDMNTLLNYSREFIKYPYTLSYKNLDVSHKKLQIVIKLTNHLTLDLLSTDEYLLTEILDIEALDSFLKIPYRSR